jgi:hypothetical protein
MLRRKNGHEKPLLRPNGKFGGCFSTVMESEIDPLRSVVPILWCELDEHKATSSPVVDSAGNCCGTISAYDLDPKFVLE